MGFETPSRHATGHRSYQFEHALWDLKQGDKKADDKKRAGFEHALWDLKHRTKWALAQHFEFEHALWDLKQIVFGPEDELVTRLNMPYGI